MSCDPEQLDESDDDRLLRLTALAIILSRPEPPPALEPDRPVERVPVAPEPDPEPEPASRRMDRPIEVLPDGTVKVRGYKRRRDGDWQDWDVPINGRSE